MEGTPPCLINICRSNHFTQSKFMSLQTNHNTTTTSLQRELDSLRQENQRMKVQLRELEMGNDDLERNERAVASSLSDVEAKYARALEEKILLEHELLDKAHLEEECQRMKDELRGARSYFWSTTDPPHKFADSNAEVSVLKDQLATAQARISRHAPSTSVSSLTPPEDPPAVSNVRKSSEDDLLRTQPPSDLDLPDFTPESNLPRSVSDLPRPSTSSTDSEAGQSALLQRAGFSLPRHKITSSQSPTSLGRSTTLPSLATPSRILSRTIVNRSTSQQTASSSTASTTAGGAATTTSRNRGVQMVSEMRAKVKNLEQKIHTRVPRLRMGSTSRPNPPVSTMSSSNSKSTSLAGSGQSSHIKFPEERPAASRRNTDNDENTRTPAENSSGWVLIMEDSPSPVRPKGREHRRTSSPPSATNFRTFASLASSSQSNSLGTPDVPSQNAQSSRRPQSRLSTSTEGRSSISTTATVSSIPTPISRPATPTFIPLPSAGLYAHPSTAGATGLKRPGGSGFGGAFFKRSSLGTSDSPTNPSFLSDSGLSHHEMSSSTSTPPSQKEPPGGKLPSQLHSNVTVRSHSKLPTPAAPNSLAQSRIGRPNFGASGRRSVGANDVSDAESRSSDVRDKGRPRTGVSSRG